MADFLAAKAITPATARKIISGKRPQKYKKDDIAASAVLHSISPKAFKLIRKKGWMQLPSVSTVADWLREFKNPQYSPTPQNRRESTGGQGSWSR